MAVRLKCSECRQTFLWDTKDKLPRYCAACGFDMGEPRADDDVCMPSIRTMRMKAADKVYRDMERGSEFRAQAAAEMAGVPVSEMSELKITDLKSSKHPGEVAAPPVNNDVSKIIQAQSGVYGYQSRGAQFAAANAAGPPPIDRMKTQNGIKTMHDRMVFEHVTKATMNRGT